MHRGPCCVISEAARVPTIGYITFVSNSPFMYTYGLRGQFSRLYQNVVERWSEFSCLLLYFPDIIPRRLGLYIGGMIHVSTPAGLFIRVCLSGTKRFMHCHGEGLFRVHVSSLFACIMGDDFSRQREMRSWKLETRKKHATCTSH